MNVLVVIFGGLDHDFLDQWPCPNLRQAEWGRVIVDELHDNRDVASQITAQLITGETWRVNGIGDRKRRFVEYSNPIVKRFEEGLGASITKGRRKREDVYAALRWANIVQRDFVKQDLRCPSLFEIVDNSHAVYVPSYNPEPQTVLDRNILDPRRYPELGVAGALDLRDKNFAWRKRRFFDALETRTYRLLVGQFQYIDSTQHLYLSYVDPPDMHKVEEAYWAMDRHAGEILDRAEGRYDRVLFVSDNGAARKSGTRPTHYNRPFYSTNASLSLGTPNIRDFFARIIAWLAEEPNAWDAR